ncbi:MAG: hypothetical protein ACI835_005435 [Planctomycetota bacterium]|jgi:hypothetical protein
MSTLGKLSWGMVILAAVLHTDLWAWDDDRLVMGFVPMVLAYHAGVSLLAALAWVMVVRFDWPEGIEEWAAETDDDETASDAGAQR